MKLIEDEKAHSNAWRSHQENTGSIKKIWGNEYSLLLVLMLALIAEQLLILLFHQGDQVINAVYYNDPITNRVEVDHQAGGCNYSQDLLEDKATQLKIGDYDTMTRLWHNNTGVYNCTTGVCQVITRKSDQ